MPIADKRVAQALQKDHLPVVVAFRSGFAGCDLGAVPDLPADDFQPGSAACSTTDSVKVVMKSACAGTRLNEPPVDLS